MNTANTTQATSQAVAGHSPGPWEVVDHLYIRTMPSHEVEHYYVATVAHIPNSAANARLIAAAPETAAERDRLKAVNADLLAALEAMQKAANEVAIEFIQNKRAANWGIINDAYRLASAAVRKARA